jgi:hypothetical protein
VVAPAGAVVVTAAVVGGRTVAAAGIVGTTVEVVVGRVVVVTTVEVEGRVVVVNTVEVVEGRFVAKAALRAGTALDVVVSGLIGPVAVRARRLA